MKKNQGFSGMNFRDIMIQQSGFNSPVYCRFCGTNVKEPTRFSPPGNDWRQHQDWEIENRAHVSCAREDYNKNNGGQ